VPLKICINGSPAGGGGFYGTPAAVRDTAPLCRAIRRLQDWEKKPHNGIRPPGARPMVGCPGGYRR
jgi:ribosomal protein S11